MVRRLLFAGFVAVLGVQRLFELRLSRRNEQQMRQHGGREHAPETYRWIVTLHAAWFAAMLLEVFAGRRIFHPRLAALALSLFAAGQVLRLTAIRTLGWRWSTRVMTVPGPEGAPVQRGIYRYIRHPNYLGVELEILAVPLVHSAYLTSAVFGIANALLLRTRIRQEEQALDAYGRNNEYGELFEDKPRFMPRLPVPAGRKFRRSEGSLL
ncbi:MAG TPA: isoprenylcysteine carboxylmethyltransferase family protein [Anaerolineales bacterium]|nr:isoprenylcysteine carboxylmethyltransferase family protein [Anaerolineales bacterium]